MKKIYCLLSVVLFAAFTGFSQDKSISVYLDDSSSQVSFSISEFSKTCQKSGYALSFLPLKRFNGKAQKIQVVFSFQDDARVNSVMKKLRLVADTSLKLEGFCIRYLESGSPIIWVTAKDKAGLMYGIMELAELLVQNDFHAIKNVTQNPYMKMRGVKFNIPLDMRTPSYSDVSDAAQLNMDEIWDFEFWKRYIDNLARYRYNFISLWSMHPFPSMVKVPDYPDIALNNVYQSTGRYKEFYSLNGHGFDAPEIISSYKVLKKISIDEKIAFWKKVMDYGKLRNVKFFVITWNIFTYGVDGKYGITDKIDNPITIDYFRKSVKQMFLTYPELAGIGLTTGENMYGHTAAVKENWAFETYGKGVLDVAAEQPGREITFIHRQHQTGSSEIAEKFKPLLQQKNVNFIFSFKYAQAHVYSSVNQVFHHNFVNDIQKNGLKTMWTLRNDDNFYFRWGAPDYVRSFIKNIPLDVSEGYYYGSDNYVWGKDFLSRVPLEEISLDIEKHWYQWMLWGRLGYNPNLGNDHFIGVIKARFPNADALNLFNAWQKASGIYPLVTGFHWGALDFQWYIESGKSASDPAQTPSGYHDVNRFITLPPHKGTNYVSIPVYAGSKLKGSSVKGVSPPDLATLILMKADSALDMLSDIKFRQNGELSGIVNDIQSIAYMGKYYGHKILAATHLALYRKTHQPECHENCIKELKLASIYWRYYASNSLFIHNNPVWTNRVGYVDWKDIFKHTLYDITANGADLKIGSMLPTTGGEILEAENAAHYSGSISSGYSGYTGKGYIESREGDAHQTIRWQFEASDEGNYLLEFRYTMKRQENFTGKIKINGKDAGELIFWPSGIAGNWVWDRKMAKLASGTNTIEIEVESWVVFDHLNLIPR
jgi:hypothetical protein